MQSSITTQQIGNDFSQQIIDLVLPIQQLEFNVPVTLEDQPDLLDIHTNYYIDGGAFWGALNGEELVGTIALLNVGHHTGVIRKMFVKKEYRGREFGIAHHLLEILIIFCRENGIQHLYLGTVDILKAAHRFYEKNGFLEIDVNLLPSYFPRMAADNKFYHLDLNN